MRIDDARLYAESGAGVERDYAPRATSQKRREACLRISVMTRKQLRDALVRAGYSRPTAAAIADVVWQAVEAVATGGQPAPLLGLDESKR